MKVKINWTLFLNVSSASKADKLVHRFVESLGVPVTVVSIERYWKEKTLFKVQACVDTEAASAGDAFLRVMQSASKLAGSWTIAGPYSDHDIWEFGGSASQGTLRIPGVDSLVFNATLGADVTDAAEIYGHDGETAGKVHLISS